LRKTRLQLRTDARTALLEPVAARWSDDELNRYLNLGQEDLAKVSQTVARAIVPVTAGTSTVTAPSTILTIDDIWWESGGTRSPVEWCELPFEINTTDSGRPYYAWYEGGDIRLWPSPQADGYLLVRGVKRPASMDTDTATHDLPDLETVNEAIVAYCVWQAYLSDYDPQRDTWAAKYAMLKADFARMELERNPRRLRVKNVYDDYLFPLTPFDYL